MSKVGRGAQAFGGRMQSSLEALKRSADEAMEAEKWAEAKTIYLEAAQRQEQAQDFNGASESLMKAAIAGERAEEWREVGLIWLRCAVALEGQDNIRSTYQPPDA